MELLKKSAGTGPFVKVWFKYCMTRPVCQACQQRLCAVNYVRNERTHYRGRCEYCIKRKIQKKPPVPRWQSSGYTKKNTCELCGFRSRYVAQLLVYHVDGDLNNNLARNLKTICQNCVIQVERSNLPWRAGDLEPDR
jgi:hypothetical protein